MDALEDLGRNPVWKAFQEISRIPRCSTCEDQVIQYLIGKAEAKGCSYRRDDVGNLVVYLPASPGIESREGVILQAHVDMVCEKNRGTDHDFGSDPIDLQVRGEWLYANGTTLGADNGIAVAYMVALMEGTYSHGPIQLLFTVDEETGLTGALHLDPSLLSYSRLINIDTEEEGDFCIGCAGGKETIGKKSLTRKSNWQARGYELLEVAVAGLRGGHSGAEIHKELGNALLIMGRVLAKAVESFEVRIVSIGGGDKHNAIPREAFALIWCPSAQVTTLRNWLADFRAIVVRELSDLDQGLTIDLSAANSSPLAPLVDTEQDELVLLLQSLPHGIQSWSRSIPGLVSTSTNLAAIRFEENEVVVLTSQRADMLSLLGYIADRVAASLRACGFSAEFTRQYPNWEPDAKSKLLETCLEVYEQTTGKKGRIQSIHAGLECGVIGAKRPGMEMISFGPDIEGAHTPQERVRIASAQRIWEFLLSLLHRI